MRAAASSSGVESNDCCARSGTLITHARATGEELCKSLEKSNGKPDCRRLLATPGGRGGVPSPLLQRETPGRGFLAGCRSLQARASVTNTRCRSVPAASGVRALPLATEGGPTAEHRPRTGASAVQVVLGARSSDVGRRGLRRACPHHRPHPRVEQHRLPVDAGTSSGEGGGFFKRSRAPPPTSSSQPRAEPRLAGNNAGPTDTALV